MEAMNGWVRDALSNPSLGLGAERYMNGEGTGCLYFCLMKDF